MGLLDNFGASFGNMTNDPKQMGLLMAAAKMMAQSGPSNRPVGLGEIMGGGMSTFLDTRNGMQEMQSQQQQRDQMAEARKLELQKDQMVLQESMRLSDFFKNRQVRGQGGAQLPAAKMGGEIFTNAAARAGLPDDRGTLNQIVSGVNQGMTPEQAASQVAGGMQGQAPQQPSEYERLMQEANELQAAGFPRQAKDAYELAIKLRPEFDQTPRYANDADGNPFAFVLDKMGNPKRLDGILPREQMQLADLGGKKEAYNPYQLKPGQTFTKTQSPDSVASVNASYANAAATREVAQSNRYAADQQRNQGIEMKLADDYRAQSKGFKEVSDAYRTINASLDEATKSPAATLAAATKFMKLLDPGSVVRESELGMALAATGAFDRLTNYYNTLRFGKVLTASQVADFKSITGQIYQAAQQGQSDLDANYKRQAEAYGLRPEMIIQNLGQGGEVVDFGSLK